MSSWLYIAFAFLALADLFSALQTNTNTSRTAACPADDHRARRFKRRGFFYPLPFLALAARTRMLLFYIHAVNHDSPVLGHNLEDFSFFSSVVSRNNFYFVAFFQVHDCYLTTQPLVQEKLFLKIRGREAR